MAINLAGFLYSDNGTAVQSADVTLLDSGGSSEATTTTNSSGYWSFAEADEDIYDIQITSGSQVRRIKGLDKISISEIDVRNSAAAGTGAFTFTNTTNSITNRVGTFRGLNSTRADGDEIYISFNLQNDAGEDTEFARITAEAVDVSNGAEDGQLRFGVAKTDGSITDVFTINSTTGGVTDMTMDVSGDINLDADGGDVFFKDGGTTFGSATNNSGNLILKSGTTTALTFTGSSVAIAGDLTISGDDLVMATNTSGHVLVADGTNYNPVAVSGDITMASNGAVTIAGTSVETGMIAADAITGAKIADDAIDSEHYTDGSIDTAHLAADAVTNAKIADDAIDSEHYADGSIDNAHIADDAIDSEHYAAASIDFAHIQNVAANSILGRNANSSGVLSEVALTSTQILIGDGTGFTAAALSGDATMTNAGVVAIASGVIVDADVNASAAISISKTALVAGTNITLSTNTLAVDDAFIKNDADDTTSGIVTVGGIVLSEAKHVNISTPLLGTTDHTFTGTTAQMLAGGAISAFDLVCIHTTTSEVVEADASAYATARVIGIAPAAISDTATGTILLHGFIRDDTYNWTTGATLYLSETAGALTETAPTTDGAFVNVVGIALSPDVVYINPSMDVIEHA